MLDDKTEEINFQINKMKIEHRDLDQMLKRLVQDRNVDELQIKRFKKRKLYLKDMITLLENQASPKVTKISA